MVTRSRHPFAGHTLSVLGQMKRHGAVELLVVLPDGSKTLMPAAWTDLVVAVIAGDSAMTGVSGTATLAATKDLLVAAALVSALQIRAGAAGGQQAARQPPGKEDDRATCPAEFDARAGVGVNPGRRRIAATEPARRRDRDARPNDGQRGGSNRRGRHP